MVATANSDRREKANQATVVDQSVKQDQITGKARSTPVQIGIDRNRKLCRYIMDTGPDISPEPGAKSVDHFEPQPNCIRRSHGDSLGFP